MSTPASSLLLALATCCVVLVSCRGPAPRPSAPNNLDKNTAGGVRLNPPLAPEADPVPVDLAPPAPVADAHDAIVVAGQRFSIGAPVVLWSDPGGYSAYAPAPFFAGPARADAPAGLRYRPGRKRGESEIGQPTLAELAELVDQFVLHFDVCGVSRQCFKVLHDLRGLSVHFMLDIDGTLYQTLDLRDTAWHARQANSRSIGIEIANMGAYVPGEDSALDAWYVRDEQGWRIAIPERLEGGGVRSPQFVGRPARPERIQGLIQGQVFEQFDYTPEQYDTLTKLAAVLCKVLPRIAPDAPRDAQGRVRTAALDAAEFADFSGILGHNHVTVEKHDPGPALEWERLLEAVRARL